MRSRSLKLLGGAVLAALAMSTGVASTANAAQFMSEGNVPVTVEATQPSMFTVEGATPTCKSAKFLSGLVASPRVSITLHPVFGECTLGGIAGITVTTTGCDLVFTAPGALVAGKTAGRMEIVCQAGRKILITLGTCEVSIGSQTISSGLTFENISTSPKTVALTAAIEGIVVTKVKDGFGCPLNGLGLTTGSYQGEARARGFDGLGIPTGVTLE